MSIACDGSRGADRISSPASAVLVVAPQPLREAEDVAEVAARRGRHRVERGLGVAGLLDDGDARLGDRRRVAAGAVGIAQAAVGVVGIEAHVHARLVVGGGEQAAECLERLRFELGAESVVAPGVAHLRLRAGAVALREQRARERELPAWPQRRVLGENRRGTAAGSGCSVHIIASARRRSMPTLGQFGLALMKAR